MKLPKLRAGASTTQLNQRWWVRAPLPTGRRPAVLPPPVRAVGASPGRKVAKKGARSRKIADWGAGDCGPEVGRPFIWKIALLAGVLPVDTGEEGLPQR